MTKRFKRDGIDFWDLVDKTPGNGPSGDCWIWTGSSLKVLETGRGGYGTYKGGKNKILAHRFSYQEKIGNIPDGYQVLHKCDVRLCVNPSHLFIGTPKDNTWDMINKGRDYLTYYHKGEASPCAILKDADVIEARRRAPFETYSEIAKDLDVDVRTLSSAIIGRTFRHLPNSYVKQKHKFIGNWKK